MKLGGGLLVKYGAYFAALVSIALLSSGALNMYFAYREARGSLARLQEEQARSAAAQIERFIRDIERLVALSPAQLSGLMANDRDEWRLELSKLLRQVPAISDAAVFDRGARELAFVSRFDPDADGSERAWTVESIMTVARRDRSYFSAVYFRNGTEPYMTIGIRGASRGDALVMADVDLTLIRDVISKIEVGTAGYAYVVDSNGFLIAHPDIGLVAQDEFIGNHVQRKIFGTEPFHRDERWRLLIPAAQICSNPHARFFIG